MESKIRIHIDDPLEPPKVFIDERSYPVVSIEYDYETSTDVHCGSHRLLVEYIGEEAVRSTVYVGFDRKT